MKNRQNEISILTNDLIKLEGQVNSKWKSNIFKYNLSLYKFFLDLDFNFILILFKLEIFYFILEAFNRNNNLSDK